MSGVDGKVFVVILVSIDGNEKERSITSFYHPLIRRLERVVT